VNLGDNPRAEFMVNSFNINFGSRQCSVVVSVNWWKSI